MGVRSIDITGKTFGYLKVVGRGGREKNYRWTCLCVCGKTTNVAKAMLESGRIKSCGCMKNENVIKHGMSNSRTYRSWVCMKNRCYGKDEKDKKHYKEKGVKVCRRWKNSFKNFLMDMGERPIGKTIDRIDRNGNYEPSNCRWATQKEQVRNSDMFKMTDEICNAILGLKGVIPVREISKRLNVSFSRIYNFLREEKKKNIVY